tara:strand:- start:317 stop:2197 length:1881 start_codon:yes stop_codon:yes gene_type:complete
MTTNRKQPVVANQDYGNLQRIENLPNAVEPQQPLTLAQAQEFLGLKQDNVSAGSGVHIEGTTINVNLAVSGTDYGTLILTGTGYSSLNGTYTLAPFKGSLTYAGTSLDLDVGGDYNVYYKDNGSGVWSIIAKRDTDNIHNNFSVGESNGSWIVVLTSVDPTSITEDYNNFIPNYQAVDFDFLTASSEQDDNGNGTVSSTASGVTYAAGNTPAGLIFENDKLAIDFASGINDAESTNVLPASIAVTAINEAESRASQAQNTTFSNAIAQLAGNPAKVQSAIEALKSLVDSVSNTVSNNQTTASTEYGHIDNMQAALGTSAEDFGSLTHPLLPDDATAIAIFEALAAAIAAVRADADNTAGITAGSLLDAIGQTVAQDSTYLEAFTALVNKVETVQGDLTNRLGSVEFYHNAEEFPLTAGQIAGTEALDVVQTGAGTGESTDVAAYVASLPVARDVRVLVSYGIAGGVAAGIYVRDKDTGFLTRAVDFDESSEIEEGDVIQVLLGGSVAFADFAVYEDSFPTIGTDPIKFKLEKAAGVGDGTVTRVKMDPNLTTEFNAKTDKFVTTVTTDNDGFATVTHDLATEDFVVQVRNTSGAKDTVLAESSGFTSTQVTIGAVPNTEYKVILIG